MAALSEEQRVLLIRATASTLPRQEDFRMLVESVRAGAWLETVPAGLVVVSYLVVVQRFIEKAEAQSWLRALVAALAAQFAGVTQFQSTLQELDRAAPVETSPNPFEEVLLAGDRPFANRRDLRRELLKLTSPAGACVLRVEGEKQTGKSFSYHLINHVAPRKGFRVNKFRMSHLPKPDALAGEILDRLGVEKALPPIGNESAERWAEKLALIVAQAIEDRASPRLFVFDEFSDTPLPDGTASLIARLATYADEELRQYLRVVLMRFQHSLHPDVEDIALRDEAKPFTATDMVHVVTKIAEAKGWQVTPEVAKERIDRLLQDPQLTLQQKFRALRKLLRDLEEDEP
jgi:hypothetical protein